jgi:hypothetical protein
MNNRGYFMSKRYNSYKNTGWTVERLQKLILKDDPYLSFKDSEAKAKFLYKELNNMNNRINKNTKKYFKHNLPFSYFEDDERYLDYFDIQE